MNRLVYETIRYYYHRIVRIPLCRMVSPQKIASKVYKHILNKSINWDSPTDINEKINWLKFYSDTSLWSNYADKYLVRKYVEEKGFHDILVPLYQKWDRAEQIDFSVLPDKFVMKTNHGSGDVLVVNDKNLLSEKQIKFSFRHWLKEPCGLYEGEPHYLRIKPCIVVEKLLEMPQDSFSTSLIDYKIWCFGGKPYYIWVCYSRTKECTYVEVRDLDWNYLPMKSVFTDHYRDGKGVVPRPTNLSYMLEIAASLSQGFPEVCVDLYECRGKVYFGELTFTRAGGYIDFYTQDFLNELGNLVVLPNEKG